MSPVITMTTDDLLKGAPFSDEIESGERTGRRFVTAGLPGID